MQYPEHFGQLALRVAFEPAGRGGEQRSASQGETSPSPCISPFAFPLEHLLQLVNDILKGVAGSLNWFC